MSIDWTEQNEKFVAALKSSDYAYARFRHGVIWAYHRATRSPTGVLMVVGTGDIEFAEKAMREIVNNSPLSPTEGLQASGARLY